VYRRRYIARLTNSIGINYPGVQIFPSNRRLVQVKKSDAEKHLRSHNTCKIQLNFLLMSRANICAEHWVTSERIIHSYLTKEIMKLHYFGGNFRPLCGRARRAYCSRSAQNTLMCDRFNLRAEPVLALNAHRVFAA